MSLKTRVERLERNRNRGMAEFTIVRRIVPDGWAVTEIRNWRIVSRREVTAEEAGRLSEGAVTIWRSYAAAERSAG